MIERPVEQLMQSPVETIDGDRSVTHAANRLAERDVGSVVVLEENVPRGIVTESDVVRLVARTDGDVTDVPVEEIVSTPLVTVDPETSIHDAASLMREEQIKKLPVTNRAGGLVGIITTTDLAAHLPRYRLGPAEQSHSSDRPPAGDAVELSTGGKPPRSDVSGE